MNHLLPPEPERPAVPRAQVGVAVLAIALALSLLLNATLGILYQDERGEAERLAERIVALEEQAGTLPPPNDELEAVIAAVERLRGLRFREPVRPEFLTSDALADRVRSLFEEDTPREDFEATQRILEAIGVVEPDAPLWDAFVASFEEQVGGYYDDTEDTLVVLADGEELSPFSRILLAHELTHAVTDQRFDLERRRELSEAGQEDAAAAFLALVEGDATLLMSLYLQQELTPGEQAAVIAEQGQQSTDSFDDLPPFLQESLLFPYTAGLTFVQALHAQGGFEAVDDAYRSPPRSTEEILHPERYMRGEPAPRAIKIRGVKGALGEGWRRIDDGDLGELDLRLMGDHQVASGGLSSREAGMAAEGWAGGAYVGFRSGDDVTVVMRAAFDSVGEATEAARLFGRWLPLRYGNIGSSFDDGAGWESPTGTGIIARDGDVLSFVLASDRATAERVAETF